MEKVEASCVRCHSIAKEGGEVGPPLDDAGKKYNRETLLESIVDPNAKISPGFETILVTLKGGMNYAGIVKKETLETLTLLIAIVEAKIQGLPSQMLSGLTSASSTLSDVTSSILRESGDAIQKGLKGAGDAIKGLFGK